MFKALKKAIKKRFPRPGVDFSEGSSGGCCADASVQEISRGRDVSQEYQKCDIQDLVSTIAVIMVYAASVSCAVVPHSPCWRLRTLLAACRTRTQSDLQKSNSSAAWCSR